MSPISAGVVADFNNKAKLTIKKAYGFRTIGTIETAVYNQLADLPEPKFTHSFW
jgi:transposase